MKTTVQNLSFFVTLTDIPIQQCSIRFSLSTYIYRQIHEQTKIHLNVLFKQIHKVWLIGLVLKEEIPNPIFRFFVRRPFNWWCLAALDTVSQLILLRISNFPHFCQWRPNGRRGEVWIRRISAISHSAQYSTVQYSTAQYSAVVRPITAHSSSNITAKHHQHVRSQPTLLHPWEAERAAYVTGTSPHHSN